MGNQQAAYILEQIERIEKRMTAMQEHGLDIGALSSQVSTAREMLNDERYGDASIFCQELMDLAEQIAQSGDQTNIAQDSSSDSRPMVIIDEDTRRINKPANLQKQLEEVLRDDVIGNVQVPMQVSSILDANQQQELKQNVLQNVAQDMLNSVLQTVPNTDNKRIERVLSDVIKRQRDNEDMSIDQDNPIEWALVEAMRKSIDQSLQSFEQEMSKQIESLRKGKHVVQAEDLQTDNVVSVQLVRGTEQAEEGGHMSQPEDHETSKDESSFSDLPRIPRHGEPLEDDSTFSSVTVDPSRPYEGETATSPQAPEAGVRRESYEPETGSNLRPNTSVFTEANSIKAKPAMVLPDQDMDIGQSNEAPVGNEYMINRAQLKQQMISLMPELLQDDDVKQALFACLAIEMVTRPSVLGSLSGLRSFLLQELNSVNQNAFQES